MGATKPRITVVTVVFNGAREIVRTIDSTLAQDYPNLEYVIVDGASTDGTQAIVRGYGSAVTTFVSEADGGIYEAMNKGAALATGDYLLFMNCGDRFAAPNALSTAADLLQTGTEQVIFGGWIREAGKRRTICTPVPDAGLFNHQATLYSRTLHHRFGGYVSVRGFSTADYLFFMVVLRSGIASATLAAPLAIIDVTGVSSGLQTFSQRHAIDYLLGRSSRFKLLTVLAGHPLYRRAKLLLTGRR
jgi:glycosyltransferase involved in cell wall biosynthesis